MEKFKICKRNYTLTKYDMTKPCQLLDPIVFKTGQKYYFNYIKSPYSFFKSLYVFKLKDYEFALDDSEIDRFFYTPIEIRKIKLEKINENIHSL